MKKNLLSIMLTGVLAFFSVGASAQMVLLVNEPANLAGSYNFTYSTTNNWGADMDTIAITADAAFAYDDGTFVDPINGAGGDSASCGAVVNSANIAGKIAVVYRGACNFSLKAHNVQDSGAVACIIINNVPGGPVGMGAGANSAGVYIPVLMISDADGAALRDSIMAGSVNMFLGNNTGLFANNIGAYRPNIGMANSQSRPAPFALTATDFTVPVGAWVHNYGSVEAVNVVVNAVIDRDGTEVYAEVSTAANIPVGDSLFFALLEFSQAGYDAGYYTLAYSISSDDTDEFPDDNVAATGFWINDSKFSKSRVDPVDGPYGGNGLRPANSTEFEWCTYLMSENASSMQITGLTFNILSNSVDLTGIAVQAAVYEWHDPILDATFDDLTELASELYDFADNTDNGEFVTYDFSAPIELLDDQKYLTCITIFDDDVFLGVDAGLDYTTTYESYPEEVFFPLNDLDGGTWFAGGFGADNVPAIVTNLELANGIAENIEGADVTPYPNPTTDMINIPFGSALEGAATLNVYDVEGRLVMTEELCLKNSSKLTLDVTGLNSGLHTFNLTFEDKSSTSFRVVITK